MAPLALTSAGIRKNGQISHIVIVLRNLILGFRKAMAHFKDCFPTDCGADDLRQTGCTASRNQCSESKGEGDERRKGGGTTSEEDA